MVIKMNNFKNNLINKAMMMIMANLKISNKINNNSNNNNNNLQIIIIFVVIIKY